ncbi:SDR family NAD(P)-dependent oxidoreductase [Nocardioides panzhihuensis]|uniref:NAD(P)-dependent dehydrogenase (Short-subunit alcohol dehydrogenase family) n=1 Tax=Nocardioides panzhihuensis TaxID=860243 RepID=A0A7Z0DI96_9ACTN|nr:SDR family oxidoreductase [Nocardioides panzhihuensis]NYI75837.1 NAD(P)-dependent dehydrogenase (short-subunit alcohol dehydrogenase family) [Nocardioides panzhihuensis]
MSPIHPATLTGKVAVVTGASSGIGAEIAHEMHRAGAEVLLVGRNQERLAATASSVATDPDRIDSLGVDLTEEAAPDAVVRRALDRFGRLDILVNAAGVFTPTPFLETTDQILDDQWATNVRAPFRLARAATGHLGEGSSIIFVSSICGHAGFPNSTAYCATKGAVELLVKSLTAELSPRGIRVNAVAPGNIRTSINEHLLADPDYEKQMLAATPAGRIGEVGDIAPAVVFLASPAASYIHGSSLLIDGGWIAS